MAGRYLKLVETAWDVCEQLVSEWQANPYRWDREIDVQLELAARLSTVCQLTGHGFVRGNYSDALEGFRGRQDWGRVACETAVRYRYSDGNQYTCHPDVVIWDDASDPDSPPDAKEGTWPILWACEIKHGDPDQAGWDLEKLRYLVKQKVIRHGCWVRLLRERAASGNGTAWVRDIADGRIWTCDARVPAL